MAIETWNVRSYDNNIWINSIIYYSYIIRFRFRCTIHFCFTVVPLPDKFPNVSRSQPGSPGLCLCAGPLQRISGRIDQASDV